MSSDSCELKLLGFESKDITVKQLLKESGLGEYSSVAVDSKNAILNPYIDDCDLNCFTTHSGEVKGLGRMCFQC